MRPYHASNKAPAASIMLMLIVALVAGLAVGGLLWAIEHFTGFYLVVVFPLVAGVIAGGLLGFVIKSGKVRFPLLAALFGIVAALVMYGVYHFAAYYVTFRGQVRESVAAEVSEPISDADLDSFIDQVLQEEVGDTGFLGYLKLSAREGFTITRTVASSSSSGIELKDTAAWVYWGVEILIAALLAAATARGAASQPFDENVNQWYGPLETLGSAPLKSRKELVNAFKNGDFETAGRLLTTHGVKGNRLDVGVRRSPDAASQDIYLVVRTQQSRNSGDIQKGLIYPSELQRLTRAIESSSQQRVLS